MIHSYERFLAANDPALRKCRGVWYTPQVAVSFIVRAVDDILQTDFDLSGQWMIFCKRTLICQWD